MRYVGVLRADRRRFDPIFPEACYGMDELIDHVARRAGLTREQARRAVEATIGFLTAKLPSPVVGRLRELLSGGDDDAPRQNGAPDSHD